MSPKSPIKRPITVDVQAHPGEPPCAPCCIGLWHPTDPYRELTWSQSPRAPFCMISQPPLGRTHAHIWREEIDLSTARQIFRLAS